jgi:hypothetical protein
MTSREALPQKLEEIPEPLLTEVLDFVRFLKSRVVEERFEAALLSESALRKDWLLPEEDEAWRNL